MCAGLCLGTLFLLLLTRISPDPLIISQTAFCQWKLRFFFFSSHLHKWIPQKSLYGENHEVSGIPWYHINAHFGAFC